MILMPTKIRIIFKNRRFLVLKPPLLADETTLFCIKNRCFLRQKARNEAVFSSRRFPKTQRYAMLTWQIIAFDFLFRKKSQR